MSEEENALRRIRNGVGGEDTLYCSATRALLQGAHDDPQRWEYFLYRWLAHTLQCSVPLTSREGPDGLELDVDVDGDSQVSNIQNNVNCTRDCCRVGSGDAVDAACALSVMADGPPREVNGRSWCNVALGQAWAWSIGVWTDGGVTCEFDPCRQAIHGGCSGEAANPGAWFCTDAGMHGSTGNAARSWQNILNVVSSLRNAACVCPTAGARGASTATCSGNGVCRAGGHNVMDSADVAACSSACASFHVGQELTELGNSFLPGGGEGIDGLGCACYDGFEGIDCGTTAADACPRDAVGRICSGNGLCTALETHNRCICDDGWDGAACSLTTCHGALSDEPCSGNGRCRRGVCACNGGYTGVTCSEEAEATTGGTAAAAAGTVTPTLSGTVTEAATVGYEPGGAVTFLGQTMVLGAVGVVCAVLLVFSTVLGGERARIRGAVESQIARSPYGPDTVAAVP